MREENRCSSAIWAAGAIGSLAALYAWSYADFAASFFVFDDFWQIAAADRIHSSKAGLSTLFEPAGSAVFFRPLTQVGYFYTLRAMWGIDPTG